MMKQKNSQYQVKRKDELARPSGIQKFLRPFRWCFKHLTETFLWVLFSLFGGLLGVVINLIQRCVFGDMSWSQAIFIDSIYGNFYTYALVLMSSIVGPMFIGFYRKDTSHFVKIKTIFMSICVFAMIFSAVFYSMNVISLPSLDTESITNEYKVDWWQLFFFVLSILVALYSLGLKYIDEDFPQNKDISDDMYLNKEESEIQNLRQSSVDTIGHDIKL